MTEALPDPLAESVRNFRLRLSQHNKDGKRFVRWHAYRCKDRDDAYRLETRLLEQHKPYLNRSAGRKVT